MASPSATPKLTKVYRLDSIPLGKAVYTEEGYLRDRPVLTSTGIFEYRNPDGTIRRELRLPEEVFAPESLKSYKGKPIIITHDAGLITKDNVHQEGVGTILSEGEQDGNDVRADIIIHDTDEMKRSGLKELSLGYNLDLDETPGVWEGKPYDAVQRNISINHLALVLEARAGDQARLNIDGRDRKKKEGVTSMKKTQQKARADGVLSPEDLNKAIAEFKARRAQRLAAKDAEANPAPAATEADPAPKGDEDTVIAPAGEAPAEGPEDAVKAVKANRDRRDAEGDPQDKETAMGIIAQQDGDIDLLFDIIDTLLAERDFASATSDGCGKGDGVCPECGQDPCVCPKGDSEGNGTHASPAEEAKADGDEDVIPNATPADVPSTMNADSIDAIVRQRIQLGMIGQTLNMDGLEAMPILAAKKAVIQAVRPGIRLDGKSAAYIDAAFDCAVADAKASTRKGVSYQKHQMFNRDSAQPKDDGQSATARRQAMIDRQQKKKEEK